MSFIAGPYKITEETIERHNLDADDLEKWMLVINGTLSIFDDKGIASKMRDQLNADMRRDKAEKDWAYYANLD